MVACINVMRTGISRISGRTWHEWNGTMKSCMTIQKITDWLDSRKCMTHGGKFATNRHRRCRKGYRNKREARGRLESERREATERWTIGMTSSCRRET